MEGNTFSLNNFLILTRLSRLVNRGHRGLKITVSEEVRIVNAFVLYFKRVYL